MLFFVKILIFVIKFALMCLKDGKKRFIFVKRILKMQTFTSLLGDADKVMIRAKLTNQFILKYIKFISKLCANRYYPVIGCSLQYFY